MMSTKFIFSCVSPLEAAYEFWFLVYHMAPAQGWEGGLEVSSYMILTLAARRRTGRRAIRTRNITLPMFMTAWKHWHCVLERFFFSSRASIDIDGSIC